MKSRLDLPLNPQLRAVMQLADLLVVQAEDLARAAARHVLRSPARRNATLRPGVERQFIFDSGAN